MKIFFVAVALSVFAQGPNPIEEAKGLFVIGKRNEAIEVLNKAVVKAKNKKESNALLSKRKLFFDQFYTAESFQHYQSSKIFFHTERFGDCVHELEKVSVGDQDNKSILELKGICQKSQNQLSSAEKTYLQILLMEPTDAVSLIELSDIYVQQKNFEQASQYLEKAEASERKTLLLAKIQVEKGNLKEAIEILREDQEKHFDYYLVLYELGRLYQKKPGSDWLARKYVALFISRCKRMSPEELKEEKLDKLCPQAQEILTDLDKKLAV